MNENNISDEKLQRILKTAGEKVGISTEELKKRLGSGNLGGIKNVDEDKLNRVLSDPEAMKKIMSSPVAKALMKKLTGKS